MFVLLALLLAGSLLGGLVVGLLSAVGVTLNNDWVMIVSYPLMFIPPMMYASYAGRRNIMFDKGYSLDNSHYHPYGGFSLAVIAVIMVLSSAFVLDAVNSILPPMPEWLEETLKGLTTGNIWLNFICVSIFAPIFEEWLCRGMVLRGLLNSTREDGTPLMSPTVAIVVSALFFAVIHLNPWQAITAFAIGLLMGYVYYKTGSLKLTMLMHFTNNTFALVLGHIDSLKDVENLRDVMTPWVYALVWALNLVIVIAALYAFRNVETVRAQGSCDEVSPEIED